MKKLLIASFLICFALTSFGQTIVGSAHDFSAPSWNGTGEICIVCHTPHNADVSVADAPLWNHDLSVATYTLYSSPTFDGAATIDQPTASSKLCLCCHDGTIALGSFGGGGGTGQISPGNQIGPDLSGHHPVSFIYDDNLATTDGELFVPSTTNSGLGGFIVDDMLFADQMQCASCHDVHNSTGEDNLLLLDNTASALCLTCHDK